MPQFEKSIEEYNILTRELDTELASYRASMPVFAKFSDVCINKTVPLTIQSERAGLWLAEMKKRGVHDYEQSSYDKNKANEIIMNILATIYKDIYIEFQKAIEAGQLALPNEQEKQYFRGCYRFFQTAKLLSKPFEKHYPYEKGTLEYNFFVYDLGRVATMATSPLGKVIYQIPPELEEKQRKVHERYEQLVMYGSKSVTETALLRKYKEPYIKKLEDASRKVGQRTELHRDARRIEKEGLDDALDAIDTLVNESVNK